MKSYKIIPALMILAVAVTGCDTVRSILGKPTSKEIELARIAKESAEQAEKDSIEMAKALEQQKLAEAQAEMNRIKRYNVIVGSYRDPANVDNMVALVEKLGETATKIEFTNGFTAVSILNTDDFHEACRKLNSTMSIDDYSFDCWIYDAQTSKHK